MEAHERRMAIWRSLCCRRQDTVAHLADEFGVSVRTIYYDVQICLSHIQLKPSEAVTKVELPDWYKPMDQSILQPGFA